LLAGIVKLGAKDEAQVEACVKKAKGFEKKVMYDKYNELFKDI